MKHDGLLPHPGNESVAIRDTQECGGRIIWISVMSSLIGLFASIYIVWSTPLPSLMVLPIMSLVGVASLFVITSMSVLLAR